MIERAQNGPLLSKTPEHEILVEAAPHHLECDILSGRIVRPECTVDGTHAAPPDFLNYFPGPDAFVRLSCCGAGEDGSSVGFAGLHEVVRFFVTFQQGIDLGT